MGTITLRPRLFLTAVDEPGLRSLANFRRAVTEVGALPSVTVGGDDAWLNLPRRLWAGLMAQAEADIEAPPLLPTTPLAGRSADAARLGNRDYHIVHAVAQRVLRHALAWLVTGDRRWVEAAHRQAACVFAEATWPEWRDQAHLTGRVDLRTGMFGREFGVAWDWLGDALSPEQRSLWIEGFDRRAIQPFKSAVAAGDWYCTGDNNWMPCVVGGLGVLGMALGDEHPDSAWLVDNAVQQMERYHAHFGPAGEFNESVGYGNAVFLPAHFWLALQYHTGGTVNRLAAFPYPENAIWQLHMTRTNGRLMDFGDGPSAVPTPDTLLAVAAATGDPVLQGFALHSLACVVAPSLYSLLWANLALPVAAPTERLPLARAFDAYGACISSRTSWDWGAHGTQVFSKAAREDCHEHNDAGQVCIDGFGEPLIVEPEHHLYPADFFGPNRWRYYHASTLGHNVPAIRGQEQAKNAQTARGRRTAGQFDRADGSWWRLDLTPLYPDARAVRRTVVHHHAGVVAVLDEILMPTANDVELSLRWHIPVPCELRRDGVFGFRLPAAASGAVGLAALVAGIDGPVPACRLLRHEFSPPFDCNRLGVPLTQHREPYVDVRVVTSHWRCLSLFAVLPPSSPDHLEASAPSAWRPSANPAWTSRRPNTWVIDLPSGPSHVLLAVDQLTVESGPHRLTAAWPGDPWPPNARQSARRPSGDRAAPSPPS